MKNLLKVALSSLMLTMLLSSCTRYGELLEDNTLGAINHQEIHKLGFGSGESSKIYVYLPMNQTGETLNPPSKEELVDTYGTAQVSKYTFPSGFFDNSNYFYMAKASDNSSHENVLSTIFSKNHDLTDDGEIGTLVQSGFSVEIHEMSATFTTDPLFVGIVHRTQNGEQSKGILSNRVLAQYKGTTIYQLKYNNPSIFGRDPYIYVSLNENNELMPLSSEMTFSSGKSSTVIRNNLILVDEMGHYINNNTLNASILDRIINVIKPSVNTLATKPSPTNEVR
jgi:hypothetical protein